MQKNGMDDYGGTVPASSEEAQWRKIDWLIDEMSQARARLSVAENQIAALTITASENRSEAREEAKKIIECLTVVNKKLDQYEGGLRIGRYMVRVGIGIGGALILFKGGDWVGGFKALAASLAG